MTKHKTCRKLKAFADNKINVTENLKFVMGRVKNTLWEKEKGFLFKVIKSWDCVVESSSKKKTFEQP